METDKPNDDEFVDLEATPEGLDPDDVVCICLGCGSVIPDAVAEKDPFFNAGFGKGVHKACGGPTTIIHRSHVAAVRKRRDNGQIVN